jgi:hypothetical protein
LAQAVAIALPVFVLTLFELTNIKQFITLRQSPKIWNCVPSSITGIKITSSSKQKLEKDLIENNQCMHVHVNIGASILNNKTKI